MPKWLSKEYGPFTGSVWLVVIVGGVGLGLAMRKFVNRNVQSSTDTQTVTPTDPGYTGVTAVTGGGVGYNQGEIVADVLEAIEAQKPPPATTNPGPTVPPPTTAPTAALVQLQQRLAGLIARRQSVVATHEALIAKYKATPVSATATRKDLLAEIEQYEAMRRKLNQDIAAVKAEIAFLQKKAS